MTRDAFPDLPIAANAEFPAGDVSPLVALGWQNIFAQQTDVAEMAISPPVRVTEVHRSGLQVLGDGIDLKIPPRSDATVGDWLLLDRTSVADSRVLERKSLIKRRAPGSDRQVQLIAANIDTAFIVTSCNQDFNVARLERYVALVLEAEANAVIVLTKPDLSDAPDRYIQEAAAISNLVPVVVLDARGAEPVAKLADWCKPGQTVAFIGSSGVGKSTLVNALSDGLNLGTQGIREDDAKGRHTTRHRQLYFASSGCAILDTPGMRELQLMDAAAGVEELFGDLHALGGQCKFRDCKHESEPGCAILAAIERGEVDAARLRRWKKLVLEEEFNSTSLAKRKWNDKALAKVIRQVQKPRKKS